MEFIDLKAQYQAYKTEIDQATLECYAQAAFILGPAVDELEAQLSDYVGGGTHCVTCANGTDALQLAMMAMGIQPGDEIVTTPFSFFATAEVIAFMGARPVFVDIDPQTYNIDIAQLKKQAPTFSKKTKAIVPVSLFGQTCNLSEIAEIAREYGWIALEDGAQSFGATEPGGVKSLGCLEISATSFFPAKPLGCYGDGGAVFTKNAAYAAELKLLRNHGQENRYSYTRIGLNSRLDALQARILQIKLKHFENEVAARQQVAEWYRKKISARVADLTIPYIQPGYRSVYAQYVVRSARRESFLKALQAAAIPTAIYYPSGLHTQSALSRFGYRSGDFPATERVAGEVFALPMHPFMNESDVDAVVAALEKA